MGAPRGAWPGKVLGPRVVIRPYNFVLKSLLFLMPFFFDFGSILGPKMASKIDQNPKKIAFETALQFGSIFTQIFIDFSFDFGPPGSSKT